MEKVKENSDWRSLVPTGVRAIIENRQLYSYDNEQSANLEKWLVSSENCSLVEIQRIELLAMKMLSTDRFLHSRNTALVASDLCHRYGFNPLAGYLAGIAHDLAKQLDNKSLIKIVKKAGLPISNIERDKPNLLHGKAASVLLRERFYIHNEDVLEAVAFHTSGMENMGPLAKVVFIADKAESSKRTNSMLGEMCLEGAELDTLLLSVLERTIKKLQEKNYKLFEDTLKLQRKIKGKDSTSEGSAHRESRIPILKLWSK
jgi:nicotinate-nucleotide adenylyltransferase